MSETMSGALSLARAPDVQIDNQAASITFSVVNETRSKIYLFDVLHDTISESGQYPLLDGAVYSEISDGTLVLSRKIVPVPADRFISYPDIPFVTALEAGETRQFRFWIGLPIQLFSPYQRAYEVRETRNMPTVLEIGYFVAVEGTDELLDTFPTTAGPRDGFYPFPVESQKIMRSGTIGELPVQLP